MAKITGRHSESFSRIPEAKPRKLDFGRFFAPSASIITTVCLSLASYSFGVAPKSAFSAETRKAGIAEGQKEDKQILFNRDATKGTRDKMAEATAFKGPEIAQRKGAEVKLVVKFSQLQEILENALNSFKNAAKYDGKRFTITIEDQAESGKGAGFIIYVKDKAFGEDRFRVREKDIGKLGKVERLEETPGTEANAEKQVVRMLGMEIERIGKIEKPDEKEVRVEIDAEKQVVRIQWDISQTFGNKPKTEIVLEEGHLSIKRAKPDEEADTKPKLFRKFNAPKKQE